MQYIHGECSFVGQAFKTVSFSEPSKQMKQVTRRDCFKSRWMYHTGNHHGPGTHGQFLCEGAILIVDSIMVNTCETT